MVVAGIAILVILSLAFAWSMGAHYTGAVMGMPYASKSISMWPALVSMSLLTVVGAALASQGVQKTVGLSIVSPASVTVWMLVVIEFGAFLLTTIYTYFKVPTSTIQILVFCIVGTGLAAHAAINWTTIVRLAITWVIAPPAAFVLGFALTKLLDRLLPEARLADASRQVTLLPKLLVVVGLAASFVLGANDVSNAVGVWTSIHLTDVVIAGLAGGVLMGVGALTWGQRILNRVAFDIVKMDLAMASAAQFVQALVVILAVTQGLFTSMNQALVGAMAGTGVARGRETVQMGTVMGILKGWAISPITGASLCFVLYKLIALGPVR
ncbi:MAG TPA: inorganic phosphate transporter [Chloroflexota bacterium]|nr:inorganic phosphate transporter [Chloroflexota bacterium]